MSKSPKKKKKGGSAVKIYARVRKLMPWEPNKVSVQIVDQCTVQNKTDKRTSQYTFSHIFNMTKTNEDIYRVMGKPLVRKVLEGFNAVLIAYGQTGSGKTHTLVGKPDQGVKGVLPFMLQELFGEPSVKSVAISGCEAYGTHVSRIELFDLFSPANKHLDWGKKKGTTALEPKGTASTVCKQLSDCWDLINQAHDASHFAPTGKNPESSRGHTAFCTKISQEDPSSGNIMTSYLIVVDLAGSEGESAFTKEFISKVDPPTLMARRLEAGCINTGLSQLQVVFNELKVKGRLSKSRGTGLRRILHAFINSNCMISVMFTLSPAMNNRVTTESTLKFAVQAGMVKVKPVKQKAKVNYKVLVDELQKHVNEQKTMIQKLNDEIEIFNDKNGDLSLKVTKLSAQLEALQKKASQQISAAAAASPKSNQSNQAAYSIVLSAADNKAIDAKVDAAKKLRVMQKKMLKRRKSAMNNNLQSHLDVFNTAKQNNQLDDDNYKTLTADEMKNCVADISAVDMDNKIKRIHTMRASKAIDINLLNASITKSTKIDITPKTTVGLDLNLSAINADNDGKDDDDNPDNTPSFADLEMRQNTFKSTLTNKANLFDDANQQDDAADIIEFQVQNTDDMTRDEIADYCEELESKLIEERTLRHGLQKSQQVIIDHLMETNEALLRWFKIKKIL